MTKGKFEYDRKFGSQEVYYKGEFIGTVIKRTETKWCAKVPYTPTVYGFRTRLKASEYLLEQHNG